MGFFLFVCFILIGFIVFIINLPIGLHSFNKGSLCGYKNIFGVEKISPQYTYCGGFYKNKATTRFSYYSDFGQRVENLIAEWEKRKPEKTSLDYIEEEYCINIFNEKIYEQEYVER